MDDDDTTYASSTGVRLSKGNYDLPVGGLCWVWQRSGNNYTGVSVRDLAARSDLATVVFKRVVEAASKTKGRRTNTALPEEDRLLLKNECIDGMIGMEIVGGTVLERACAISNGSMNDLESALTFKCPWSSASSHRIEISSSSGPQLGSRPSHGAICESAGLQIVQPTEMISVSEISQAMQMISAVLSGINHETAMGKLNQIQEWMSVALLKVSNIMCLCVPVYIISFKSNQVQIVFAAYPCSKHRLRFWMQYRI